MADAVLSQALNRRNFLIGSLAALLDGYQLRARAAPAVQKVGGCISFESLGTEQQQQDRFPGLRLIGKANDEVNLVPIYARLSQLFEVMPAFGVYDDSSDGIKGNAYAYKPSLLKRPDGTTSPDGMVAFGLNYFRRLKTCDIAPIAGVWAHEFGHILQYKFVSSDLYNLYLQDLTVVRAELHADYVSGYFAAIQKLDQIDYDAALQALNQFSNGDCQFDDLKHHGTDEERGKAVEAGFSLGIAGRKSPQEVANAGLEYVRNLTIDQSQSIKSGSCQDGKKTEMKCPSE
jgi:hypothetical protein